MLILAMSNRDAVHNYKVGQQSPILFRTLTHQRDTSLRTAVRGTGGGYANRWTLATIDGVNSYTHSHKPTYGQKLSNKSNWRLNSLTIMVQ